MGSVLVSEAGRSDQEGATQIVYSPEQNLNEGAAPSPDRNSYEAYPDRCIQLTLDGGRCRGKAIKGKQGLCMVHCEKVPNDEE